MNKIVFVRFWDKNTFSDGAAVVTFAGLWYTITKPEGGTR